MFLFKKHKQKKIYIGHVVLTFYRGDDKDNIVDSHTLCLIINGEGKRAIEVASRYDNNGWKSHEFYLKYIFPWLNGGKLPPSVILHENFSECSDVKEFLVTNFSVDDVRKLTDEQYIIYLIYLEQKIKK